MRNSVRHRSNTQSTEYTTFATPPLATMLSEQLKLVRQQRSLRQIRWTKKLKHHLRLRELRDTGSHVRDAAATSFAFWSPFFANCLALTSETIVKCSSQLSINSVVAVSLCLMLELCCLSGMLHSAFHRHTKQLFSAERDAHFTSHQKPASLTR